MIHFPIKNSWWLCYPHELDIPIILFLQIFMIFHPKISRLQWFSSKIMLWIHSKFNGSARLLTLKMWWGVISWQAAPITYTVFICFYVLHLLIQSESHHMIFIAPYFVVPCRYSTLAVEAQVSLRSVMMALRAVAWITLLPRLLAEVRGPENWSFPSLVLENFHIPSGYLT